MSKTERLQLQPYTVRQAEVAVFENVGKKLLTLAKWLGVWVEVTYRYEANSPIHYEQHLFSPSCNDLNTITDLQLRQV